MISQTIIDACRAIANDFAMKGGEDYYPCYSFDVSDFDCSQVSLLPSIICASLTPSEVLECCEDCFSINWDCFTIFVGFSLGKCFIEVFLTDKCPYLSEWEIFSYGIFSSLFAFCSFIN